MIYVNETLLIFLLKYIIYVSENSLMYVSFMYLRNVSFFFSST